MKSFWKTLKTISAYIENTNVLTFQKKYLSRDTVLLRSSKKLWQITWFYEKKISRLNITKYSLSRAQWYTVPPPTDIDAVFVYIDKCCSSLASFNHLNHSRTRPCGEGNQIVNLGVTDPDPGSIRDLGSGSGIRDPWSGAFLTPGSGSRVSDPAPQTHIFES